MRIVLALDWFLKYGAEQAAGLAGSGVETLLLCRDHFEEFGGDPQEWKRTLDRLSGAGVSSSVIRGRVRNRSAARTAAQAARRLSASDRTSSTLIRAAIRGYIWSPSAGLVYGS